MRLFAFGLGFAATALARRLRAGGWAISASCRREGDAERLTAEGVEPVALDDPLRLAEVLGRADALLISAPSTAEGCPGMAALASALAGARARPAWTGYLSTTGVY
ncbi:MAG TPA: hypothetical protein VIR81_08120, partial [Myxococcales bacterium]